jgi:predicted  nucleic acid-binding Zn-ribbon protein
MEEIYQSLLALQELDNEIVEAERKVTAFEPELKQVDAPAQALAQETEAARARLQEQRDGARRLERGATEKRDLLQRYQERLEKVRTAREESAAQTEIDLIRRAVEADEVEALELMEQVVRSELKVDELERNLAAARASLEPRRAELASQQAAAGDEVAVLKDRRQNLALRLDRNALQLYDRIRGGRTRVAITGLTPDGACGCCFGVVPLQRQTEIRQGPGLVRCEACGVILHPGD